MSEENNTQTNPVLRFTHKPSVKPLLEDIPPNPDLGEDGMKESDGLNALLGDFMEGSKKASYKGEKKDSDDGGTTTTTTVTTLASSETSTTNTSTTAVTTPVPANATTTETATGTTPAPPPAIQDPSEMANQITKQVTENLEKKFGGNDSPSEVRLPESEQLKIRNLKKMEQLNPDKYKGYSEAYEKNVTAYQAYADKWKTENPGKTFDPSDYEHSEFLESHSMEDYESDDYAMAAAKVEGERVREEFESKQRQEEHRKQIEPKIQSNSSINAGKVITGIIGAENAKAFLGDKGGVRFDANGNLPSEAMNSHPDIGELIKEAATEAKHFNITMDRMFSGLDQFDQSNPDHVTIVNFIDQQEKDMMQLPVEARRNDQNQYFLPGPEYYKMSEDKRAAYWTFTDTQLKEKAGDFLINRYKGLVASEQKKFQQYLEAKGYKNSGDQNSSQTASPRPRGRRQQNPYEKQHNVDPNEQDTPPKAPQSPDGGLKPGKVGDKPAGGSDRDKRVSGWFDSF